MKKLLTIAAICMLCTSCTQIIPNLAVDGKNPFVVARIESLGRDNLAVYYSARPSNVLIKVMTDPACVILPIGAYQLNDTITIP